MTLARTALVLGHAGPGRTATLAALVRAFGSDVVGAALARGARAGLGGATRGVASGTLEIGSASRIRASGYALFREAAEITGPPPDEAVQLGLSEYAYYGFDDFEPYRALGRPLPAPLPGLRCDPKRPWAIVEGIGEGEARAMLRALASRDEAAHRAGVAEAQLHTFLPHGAVSPGFGPDVVRWLDWPSTVGSVLGHARVVVSKDGPLAWDALRLSRIHLPLPSARATDAPHARPGVGRAMRLAAVIPPALLGDPATVRSLIEGGPAGFATFCRDVQRKREAIEARIGQGGSTRADASGVGLALRRWRKLREEPVRFLRESQWAGVRRVGRAIGRR